MEPIKNITHNRSNLHWWLLLLSGISMVLLGIYILFTPATSYFSLSIIFALGMVFSGLFELSLGIFSTLVKYGRGWLIAGGSIDLMIGIYLLYYPLLSMLVLPAVMGLWMLFRGGLAVGGAIENREQGSQWVTTMILGAVILICSFIVLNNPILGIINIVVWTAMAFILSGVFRIYQSLIHRRTFYQPG